MGHSQVAAFARLANGQVTPTRNIFGQNTLITRSIHKFAYDPVKDEIVVPQFQAQAILFFRGGANGDEAPVRVIKGPDVKLPNMDQLAIDSVHREIFIGVYNEYPRREFIAVYPLDGNGNVGPLRVIEGPDTQIHGGRNGGSPAVDGPIVEHPDIDLEILAHLRSEVARGVGGRAARIAHDLDVLFTGA